MILLLARYAKVPSSTKLAVALLACKDTTHFVQKKKTIYVLMLHIYSITPKMPMH